MKKIIILSFVLLSQILFSQAEKDKLIEMMYDSNINFYDVCEYAETYFKTIEKGTKGSGWKPFQRWKAENESKFYPSGNRSTIDFTKEVKNFEKLRKEYNFKKKKSATSGWEELGPIAPGEITGHYSFGMGRIVSFYINPSNTDIMYLGSRTGGFWKTIDGGTNWTGGVTDFLPAAGVNTIAVKPSNSNDVLINVNNSRNHYTHGIYRSNNGGDTFTESNFNPTNLGWGGLGSNREIYKIKYHPTIPNLVFIGTRVGLYRSTDDLQTTSWTIPVSGDDFTDIDFHPTDPSIVYAYAKNQPDVIYVSTDTGVSFSTVSISGNSGSVGTVQVSASCEDCVYYFSNNGYWKSTDKGLTFTQISSPSLSDAGFSVSDLDDNNILAGYVDAFFSTDGGANFNQVTYWSLGNTNGSGSGHQNSYNTSTNYIHADLQAAECINGVFYACTDGFLVKSADNGQNWNILSENGVGIRMNYNLGVSQSNDERAICGSQDNGTSIQTENGWVEMYGADGMEGFIHPLNDDWMIGSLQNGGRRRTKNGGQNNEGVTPSGQTGYWIAPLFYDPNDHMTVYSLGENVHKSTDFGDTWTELGTPSFSGTIKYATIAENNSNLIIATQNSSIELSIDGGNTFTSIRGTLPNSSITDVVFDPNDDDTIIVTYGSYQDNGDKIYVSHNQGTTWSNITHNLSDMPIRSVVIDHTDDSNIYLGAEIGVYKMAMNGSSWSLYSSDLPNVSVQELEIMKGSNKLKASTWGRGLWEFAIDGREEYPAITKTSITHTPTDMHPKVDIDQYVTSEISYSNTLTNVELKWSLNNPVFDNSITMNNVSGATWKSDSPIPNHPVGTKIYFKVVAEGSTSDITETYKFMYTVKEGGFCNAIGSNASGNLYLSQVSIENVNNSSTNDTYSYYTSEVVNLTAGDTYTITLNANTGWSSNDFGAWIDFDNDTDFEDAELILSDINSGNSATATFTVPSDAEITDNVRMRVRLGYWDNPNLDSCGETLGEVEDYPVNIAKSGTNWNGSVSTDWATAGNWSSNTIPTTTDDVTIPNVVNKPIISATTGAVASNLTVDNSSSLTINGGGSLIISGTSTGNITYNLAIPDANWHLVSSPVVGEEYDNTWIATNSIASGTGDNKGIAPYNNSLVQPWEYFQEGNPAITFGSGVGYSALRTATGTYSFTGTYADTNVTPTISQGNSNWNLIGNPYSSYLNIEAFITTNLGDLPAAFQAIYVWQGTSPTTGNYNAISAMDGEYISPGQGFFVNSTGTSASITEAMQSHQTGVTFHRTINPSIKLTLSDGTDSKDTKINYLEGKTTGLDPGFDLGMFNGTSSNLRVFTNLIENNEGVAFQTQALPNSDLESMIIPVGVKAVAGKELTFSIEALNLPTELKVFLEDKTTNTFIRLDEIGSEYKVTLSEDIDGIGRFYLHTSTNVLSIDNSTLNSVYIYKPDVSTLRITGLPEGKITIKLFNVLGKEFINTTFEESGIKDISLPKFAAGIYIVKIQTEVNELSKKIILE